LRARKILPDLEKLREAEHTMGGTVSTDGKGGMRSKNQSMKGPLTLRRIWEEKQTNGSRKMEYSGRVTLYRD